jgi:hypothetical protein
MKTIQYASAKPAKLYFKFSSLVIASLILQAGAISAQTVKKTLKAQSAEADTATLFINPSGYVGIGTTDPHNKLQLNGDLHMDGNAIYFRKDWWNKTAFIKWNLTDEYNGQDDDKLAIGAWHGVKLVDKSHGTDMPVLQAGFDITPGIVDIRSAARTGIHPNKSAFTLYVTGPMDNDNGVQFRTNDGTEGIGFGKNLIYQTGVDKNLNFQAAGAGNLTFHTNGSERMFIRNDGLIKVINDFEVGGIARLSGQITLGNPLTNITAVNNSQGTYMEFKNKGAGNSRYGFRFTEDEGGTPILRIRDGNVGINTDKPDFPLHIKRTQGSYSTWYSQDVSSDSHEINWGGPSGTNKRGFSTCSLLADGDIVTNSAVVSTRQSTYSDIRLKKDISQSSSIKDLAILRSIKVSDYKMIDTLQDNNRYKKVIAQQVQQVYPQAITTYFKTLPDIYLTALTVTQQADSVYQITLPHARLLKTGEKLEVHCAEIGSTVVNVIAVTDGKTFSIKSPLRLNLTKGLFVYGHPATDVLTVDYDAISMLNVSATQQLAKIIDEQQKEIALLKAQNATLATENTNLKNEQASTKAAVTEIFTRLAKIEEQTGNKPTLAQIK